MIHESANKIYEIQNILGSELTRLSQRQKKMSKIDRSRDKQNEIIKT